MNPIGSFRALRPSLRLVVLLAALSVIIAAYYLVFPGHSASIVVPAFFAVHGLVALWASQESFAASRDLRGCGLGVGLWLWLSLEFMVLAGIWVMSEGGPH